ncbi:unnamed protein product [Symbiodinium sp. CCMP2592]|nr:unnamed protein product [Symbiodinium sp. CCMP2592]
MLALQVIRCVFPDGRDEAGPIVELWCFLQTLTGVVRFAALNLKLGCLDLFEVFIDDDEKVTLGEATRVPFAAIKVADADGNVVRISSQSGMLVEMTFAQGPGPARAWADFINKARKADTSRLPQEGAGLGPQLRAAVAKQEEQVRLLEALVQRKGEQQQQLQAHLEGLLERLDLGRELFAEQEKVIRVQQAKVHRLQAAKAALAVELAPAFDVEPCLRDANSRTQWGDLGCIPVVATSAMLEREHLLALTMDSRVEIPSASQPLPEDQDQGASRGKGDGRNARQKASTSQHIAMKRALSGQGESNNGGQRGQNQRSNQGGNRRKPSWARAKGNGRSAAEEIVDGLACSENRRGLDSLSWVTHQAFKVFSQLLGFTSISRAGAMDRCVLCCEASDS